MGQKERKKRFVFYPISLLLVTFVLSAFIAPLPVMAAPVLTLVPSSGPVGAPVTISGNVFDSYEGDIIYIYFDSTQIEGSPIVVPSGGSFTISTVIPAAAIPGPHIIGVKTDPADASFFSSAVFTVEKPALSLSKDEGPVGTDVRVSGSGFYAGKDVTINYYNPTANIIGKTAASSAGSFSMVLTIPAGLAGNHKFTAFNDIGNSAEVIFKVIPSIALSANAAPPGEWINVRGSGFGSRSALNVFLGYQAVAWTYTDETGSFEADFVVPEITPLVYDLKAQDNLGHIAQSKFTIAAGAFLSENFGSIGNPVTVRGRGFLAGNEIAVHYDDALVASSTADNNGDFTVIFNVPPSSGGDHLITVSDGITTREYTYTVETIVPQPPALLLPENNGLTGAFTYFQWKAVPDTSEPVTYILEISSDRNFSDTVLRKAGIDEPQYTLAGEEAMTADFTNYLFFWRVMATDAAGNKGGWSETRAFYVDVPKAPDLVLPANGAIAEFPLRLSWERTVGLSGPVTYSLQVSRNIEFSELLMDEKGLESADYVVPEESKKIFNKDIPYYWRVKAVDNAGNTGEWSAVGSFNIKPSGFPVWATVILIIIAAGILALAAFRIGRRSAYH